MQDGCEVGKDRTLYVSHCIVAIAPLPWSERTHINSVTENGFDLREWPVGRDKLVIHDGARAIYL
jgi:hypothetical protein